jgi:hypothetical protein
MKRKDWLCPACGEVMLNSSCGRFMVCMRCWAPMCMAWGIKDLPLATRIDYKRFTIDGEPGYWKYVPWTHDGCLSRAPEPGYIVARVRTAKWAISHPMHRVATFKPTGPPREKK